MAITAEHIQAAPFTMTTRVVAIYVHGPRPSREGDSAPTPMIAHEAVEALTAKGLREDARYCTGTRRGGQENLRQVSLIDEGTLARHEARFGQFPHEYVKSQIVLAGDIRLSDLLGRRILFDVDDGGPAEGAILELTIPRRPCFAMDLIVDGLREAMKEGEQGALARVIRGGTIRVGGRVSVC